MPAGKVATINCFLVALEKEISKAYQYYLIISFNKTIIPVTLVGYEIGYSQLGATCLASYLSSHTQRALIEYLLNIAEKMQSS